MKNALKGPKVAAAMLCVLIATGNAGAQTPEIPQVTPEMIEANRAKMKTLMMQYQQGEITQEELEAAMEAAARADVAMTFGKTDVELVGASFGQRYKAVAIRFERNEAGVPTVTSVDAPMSILDRDGWMVLWIEQRRGEAVEVALYAEGREEPLDLVERRDGIARERGYVYDVPEQYANEETRFRVVVDPEGKVEELYEGANNIVFTLDDTEMRSEIRRRKKGS